MDNKLQNDITENSTRKASDDVLRGAQKDSILEERISVLENKIRILEQRQTRWVFYAAFVILVLVLAIMVVSVGFIAVKQDSSDETDDVFGFEPEADIHGCSNDPVLFCRGLGGLGAVPRITPPVTCFDSFNDCECLDGFSKENDQCHRDEQWTWKDQPEAYGCSNDPVLFCRELGGLGAVPRITPPVTCFVSFDDCECLDGFAKQADHCREQFLTVPPQQQIHGQWSVPDPSGKSLFLCDAYSAEANCEFCYGDTYYCDGVETFYYYRFGGKCTCEITPSGDSVVFVCEGVVGPKEYPLAQCLVNVYNHETNLQELSVYMEAGIAPGTATHPCCEGGSNVDAQGHPWGSPEE